MSGASGGACRLNPESNVQFGEGGAGTFSDGQAAHRHQGPRVSHTTDSQGLRGLRRAGGNHLYQQAAHRHAAAREGGREPAPQNRRAGRRDPLRGPGHGYRHRKWRGARDHARQRRTHRDRPRRARRRPQRAIPSRCCTPGACTSRRSRSPSASASSTCRTRSTAAASGRAPAIRRLGAADYKLMHHGTNGRSVYSFCIVPRRAGGGRDVGSRGRGHERHEPLLAQ